MTNGAKSRSGVNRYAGLVGAAVTVVVLLGIFFLLPSDGRRWALDRVGWFEILVGVIVIAYALYHGPEKMPRGLIGTGRTAYFGMLAAGALLALLGGVLQLLFL